jgi:hypothetical protein
MDLEVVGLEVKRSYGGAERSRCGQSDGGAHDQDHKSGDDCCAGRGHRGQATSQRLHHGDSSDGFLVPGEYPVA